MFGPVNENSNEAQLLKEHNGAFEVHNEKNLSQILQKLFDDQEYRKKTGQAASKIVIENTGATEKTLKTIMSYLDL